VTVDSAQQRLADLKAHSAAIAAARKWKTHLHTPEPNDDGEVGQDLLAGVLARIANRVASVPGMQQPKGSPDAGSERVISSTV
jgi:hypothetical protein